MAISNSKRVEHSGIPAVGGEHRLPRPRGRKLQICDARTGKRRQVDSRCVRDVEIDSVQVTVLVAALIPGIEQPPRIIRPVIAQQVAVLRGDPPRLLRRFDTPDPQVQTVLPRSQISNLCAIRRDRGPRTPWRREELLNADDRRQCHISPSRCYAGQQRQNPGGGKEPERVRNLESPPSRSHSCHLVTVSLSDRLCQLSLRTVGQTPGDGEPARHGCRIDSPAGRSGRRFRSSRARIRWTVAAGTQRSGRVRPGATRAATGHLRGPTSAWAVMHADGHQYSGATGGRSVGRGQGPAGEPVRVGRGKEGDGRPCDDRQPSMLCAEQGRTQGRESGQPGRIPGQEADCRSLHTPQARAVPGKVPTPA
ncbi:hypothetical protein M2168_005400 [Streptomyces sp. CZ24]|nr:hypothetical protein [Streptomyces sp. CZ24]